MISNGHVLDVMYSIKLVWYKGLRKLEKKFQIYLRFSCKLPFAKKKTIVRDLRIRTFFKNTLSKHLIRPLIMGKDAVKLSNMQKLACLEITEVIRTHVSIFLLDI